MNLKRPKKTGGTKKKQARPSTVNKAVFDSDNEDEEGKVCNLQSCPVLFMFTLIIVRTYYEQPGRQYRAGSG